MGTMKSRLGRLEDMTGGIEEGSRLIVFSIAGLGDDDIIGIKHCSERYERLPGETVEALKARVRGALDHAESHLRMRPALPHMVAFDYTPESRAREQDRIASLSSRNWQPEQEHQP